jgi:hypothetical protein
MTKPTAETAGAAMALPILDAAVATAYGAFCDIGLTAAAARDALITQVADTVTALAYERDGVPAPADEDDTGGGVRPR